MMERLGALAYTFAEAFLMAVARTLGEGYATRVLTQIGKERLAKEVAAMASAAMMRQQARRDEDPAVADENGLSVYLLQEPERYGKCLAMQYKERAALQEVERAKNK